MNLIDRLADWIAFNLVKAYEQWKHRHDLTPERFEAAMRQYDRIHHAEAHA